MLQSSSCSSWFFANTRNQLQRHIQPYIPKYHIFVTISHIRLSRRRTRIGTPLLKCSNRFPSWRTRRRDLYATTATFEDSTRPDVVRCLHRSLYGLRQSSRVWYYRLHHFLTNTGYNRLKNEPNVCTL